MVDPAKEVGWTLAIKWMLASVAALILALVIDRTLGQQPSLIASFVLMAALQWLVLRRHLPGSGWWIVAAVSGIAIGLVVSLLVSSTLRGDEAPTVGLSAMAIFQWLFLRTRIRAAGWWVLANLLGWLAAALVAVYFVLWTHPECFLGTIFGGEDCPVLWQLADIALAATIYGGITGLALVLLLRRRRSEPEQASAGR